MAETIGTFLLVFLGCTSAVFSGGNIGWLGVSLSFGLTLMACAFIFGGISGCHLNPAVTLGLALARRFPGKDILAYVLCQLAGAALGGGLLYLLAQNCSHLDISDGLALTGMGQHSPTHCPLWVGFLAETVGTFVLVLVVLLATQYAASLAPIAIGSILTVLLLGIIPITNGSLNIARSFGVALYHGGWALSQLPYFLGAQALAALLAALVTRLTCCCCKKES